MSSRKPLTYRDAVTLLAGTDSAASSLLDGALTSGILASFLWVGPASLPLIGVKNELLKFGQAQINRIGENVKGIKLAERSKRIQAAHAVLVITSFLEASEAFLGEALYNELQLQESELLAVVHQGLTANKRAANLKKHLEDGPIPFPSQYETIEGRRSLMRNYYLSCATRLRDFIQGLEVWQQSHRKNQLIENFVEGLASQSIEIYESYFMKLVGEVPEFLFWSMTQEIAGSRRAILTEIANNDNSTSISDLKKSLANVEAFLSKISEGIPNSGDSRWRRSLFMENSSELGRRLVETVDVDGVTAPTVEYGYVDPAFRFASYTNSSTPAREDWWADKPRREDLPLFLTNHLTSSMALEYPLLIIGHPGAGKSMLSRVITARLPSSGFMPVRVTLREVAANAAIEAQVEAALFSTIHERVSWPQLIESAPNLMPIIILDGLDELLQATGVNQSDYLDRVARFQEMEYNQGRPVAIIVTSRITVIDNASMPPGTPMVKLEEFSRDQVEDWLSSWNDSNEQFFRANGTKPLTADRLEDQMELARQPVLLLMLALYDGTDNSLDAVSSLGRAGLYEELLRKFVRREVLKDGVAGDSSVETRVESELYELSIVALGMFNRGQQMLRQSDLDMDLRGLGQPEIVPHSHTSFNPVMTQAERTFGRFFFVHSSEAVDGVGVRENASSGLRPLGRTFEFMHATFGEYLVARLAAVMMGAIEIPAPTGRPWEREPRAPETSLFSALFSYHCFSGRLQVILFLREIFKNRDNSSLYSVARWMLQRLSEDGWENGYPLYRPVPRAGTERIAALSANVVLMLASAFGAVAATELFLGEFPKPHQEWRRWGLLWESQLDPESWAGLAQTLTLIEASTSRLQYGLNVGDEMGHSGEVGTPAGSGRLLILAGESEFDPVDRFPSLRRRSGLVLDWGHIRAIETLEIFNREFGFLAHGTVFDAVQEYSGLSRGHYGSTYLASLMCGMGTKDELSDYALGLFKLLHTLPENRASAAAEIQLLSIVEGRVNSLDIATILSLIQQSGRMWDANESDSARINTLKLRILMILWASEGEPALGMDALSIARDAWAALDPVHLADVEPERIAMLLVGMMRAGMPINEIASEYGMFPDWVDRLGLSNVALRDERAAYQVLAAIVDFDFLAWAAEALPILSYLPVQTIERLNSKQRDYFVNAAGGEESFRDGFQALGFSLGIFDQTDSISTESPLGGSAAVEPALNVSEDTGEGS